MYYCSINIDARFRNDMLSCFYSCSVIIVCSSFSPLSLSRSLHICRSSLSIREEKAPIYCCCLFLSLPLYFLSPSLSRSRVAENTSCFCIYIFIHMHISIRRSASASAPLLFSSSPRLCQIWLEHSYNPDSSIPFCIFSTDKNRVCTYTHAKRDH